jgi:D-alanyl-D-alanine dipeptidase
VNHERSTKNKLPSIDYNESEVIHFPTLRGAQIAPLSIPADSAYAPLMKQPAPVHENFACSMRILAAAAIATISAGVSFAADAPRVSDAQTAEAAGMVSIQSLVPDIRLEIRYATDNNFVGDRVRGYEAPRCYLLEPVAEALQRVELSLREQHLRLKIFDCYRPVRAVQHFVEWAGDLNNQTTKPRYYPKLHKRDLLGDYIAPTSGHSRGATVDLTLMRCDDDCTDLDMGTEFDFFDVLAHTDAPDITSQQRENRHRLRDAMGKAGFQNYPLEWWHYTFQPEPSKEIAYDFPVQ